MNSGKVAVLFPGQGSQYIGMGSEFVQADTDAAAILAQAEAISGFPLKSLCFEGPMEELTAAVCLQPALTAVNLLSWKVAQKAGLKADYFAGHSLGEYSALCAAGILTLEDTLRLVAARGRIMGETGARNPGAMMAILGLSIAEVEGILKVLACPDQISIGNYNSAQQIVLSGTKDSLAKAGDIAVERGGKAVALNVSIANHSPLMNEAVAEFECEFASVEMRDPEVPVFFNVTGAIETDMQKIRSVMVEQIVSMVRWYETINGLVDLGVETFVEIGPKKVLTGLMKRLLPKGGAHRCFQIDTPELLQKFMDQTA
nr:ACP S-malonyltransferase [Desulfobulbaceae bacterium]